MHATSPCRRITQITPRCQATAENRLTPPDHGTTARCPTNGPSDLERRWASVTSACLALARTHSETRDPRTGTRRVDGRSWYPSVYSQIVEIRCGCAVRCVRAAAIATDASGVQPFPWTLRSVAGMSLSFSATKVEAWFVRLCKTHDNLRHVRLAVDTCPFQN
jgi:hypothetical protein